MLREILGRFRAPILFAALMLVALITMQWDRGSTGREGRLPWLSALVLELSIPIQRAVTTPADLARGVWESYIALTHARAENESLRRENAALRDANLQLREALVESGRLERIAAMREQFEIPMLPLEVVGQDVSPWFRALLLDGGRDDGVASGMPVITDQGVVGLVTATASRGARTMLLLDRQSAIHGIVQRSRARGIVRGLGTDRLEFELVVRGDDVAVGDVVIASGLGAVYPKGLRIGEVVEVEESLVGLTRRALIRPAVDLGRLEQVFVMLWRGPAMDLLYDDAPPGGATPEPDPASALEPLPGDLPPGETSSGDASAGAP